MWMFTGGSVLIFIQLYKEMVLVDTDIPKARYEPSGNVEEADDVQEADDKGETDGEEETNDVEEAGDETGLILLFTTCVSTV